MPNNIRVLVIILFHALMLGLNSHVQVNAASLKHMAVLKAAMTWLNVNSFNVFT